MWWSICYQLPKISFTCVESDSLVFVLFYVFGFLSQTRWLMFLKVIWVSGSHDLISPWWLYSLCEQADTALGDRVFDHPYFLCHYPGVGYLLNISIIFFSHQQIISIISGFGYLFKDVSALYLMMSGDRQVKGLECHSVR